jgi:transposase-like protein
MGNIKKHHSIEFKSKVTMEALSGRHTLAELSSKYGIHPTEISRWKKHATENFGQLFSKSFIEKQSTHTEKEFNDMRLLIGKMALKLEDYKKNWVTEPLREADVRRPERHHCDHW